MQEKRLLLFTDLGGEGFIMINILKVPGTPLAHPPPYFPKLRTLPGAPSFVEVARERMLRPGGKSSVPPALTDRGLALREGKAKEG